MTQKTLNVLILGQTPPPHHGVNVVTGKVRDILESKDLPETHNLKINVTMKSVPGGRSLSDIGKGKTLKMLRLFKMILGLLFGALNKRYDVVYLPFCPGGEAKWRDAMLASTAKDIGKRVLIHVHGEGLRHALKKPFIKKCLKGTELVAITEKTQKTGQQSKAFKTCWLLPNAVPSGKARKPVNTTLKICYIANLKPKKGVITLLDTLYLLAYNHVAFWADIIGDASRDIRSRDLSEMAQRRKIKAQTIFHGPLYGASKEEKLLEADIFLYPSRHDHAPLVILEALAAGCVPIVLDTGGIADMVGPDFVDYVVESDQPDHIVAEKMAQLVKWLDDNPQKRRELQKKARKRYLENYTLELFSQRLLTMMTTSPSKKSAKQPGEQFPPQ